MNGNLFELGFLDRREVALGNRERVVDGPDFLEIGTHRTARDHGEERPRTRVGKIEAQLPADEVRFSCGAIVESNRLWRAFTIGSEDTTKSLTPSAESAPVSLEPKPLGACALIVRQTAFMKPHAERVQVPGVEMDLVVLRRKRSLGEVRESSFRKGHRDPRDRILRSPLIAVRQRSRCSGLSRHKDAPRHSRSVCPVESTRVFDTARPPRSISSLKVFRSRRRVPDSQSTRASNVSIAR